MLCLLEEVEEIVAEPEEPVRVHGPPRPPAGPPPRTNRNRGSQARSGDCRPHLQFRTPTLCWPQFLL